MVPRIFFFISAAGTASAFVSEQYMLVLINTLIGVSTCYELATIALKKKIKKMKERNK